MSAERPPQAESESELEESELEQATAWLEMITRDPMADAVSGRATVVCVDEPGGRGRYREHVVVVLAEGPGIPLTSVEQRLVFDTRKPPAPGIVLPARISVSDPQVLEVNWESMRAK